MRRGVQRLKQLGVTSIAVMYLFSFVNPEHERRTREIVLEEFPDVEHISLSHEVMPRGPEFERVSTTLVNTYVAPGIADYTVAPPGRVAPRRLRRPAADHAVDRRRDAPRLRRAPRGDPARFGPDRRRDGRDPRREPRRRRRLPRRRHGRHQLRHLPGAPRPARDQDRLELAVPLLHRAPDGRRAERGRGRRLDRPRAPGRAARRSGIGRLRARARCVTAAAAPARP